MIRVHLPDRVETVSSMDGALRVVATWADVPTRSVRVVLDASTDKLAAHQRKTTTHGHMWEPLAIVFEAPPAEGGVPVGATAVRIVTRDVPQDGTLFASAPQRAQVATHDGADVAIQASQQQASGAWTLVGGVSHPNLASALTAAGYKVYLHDGDTVWCAAPYSMGEEVAFHRPPKPRVGQASRWPRQRQGRQMTTPTMERTTMILKPWVHENGRWHRKDESGWSVGTVDKSGDDYVGTVDHGETVGFYRTLEAAQRAVDRRLVKLGYEIGGSDAR